jgi:competence protein ComGC
MRFSKTKSFKFTLTQLLVVVAIIGLLSLFMLPAAAQQYQTGQPNFVTPDTNAAAFTLTSGQTQTFTAGGTNTLAKTIRQNQGLGLFLTVWQTNSIASTTTNYTVKFDTTGDGTTWTKGTGQYPIVWTVSLAGAGVSTNTFWTNLPPAVLNNIRKIQATSTGTTASNNIFGSLQYSQSVQ